MGFVYHSGQLMRPLFQQAKQAPKRVVYADGEDERVLRAVQTVIDEKLAEPTLVGRPAVIEMRIRSSACAWFRARTSRSSTRGRQPLQRNLEWLLPVARPRRRDPGHRQGDDPQNTTR